ncbi:MAG: hypothetical protein WDZ54_09425 [Sneathiella sp.]
MRYLLVIGLFLLTSCATVNDEPADISDVDLNNPYAIGWYTTYSDICRHFRGSGADLKVTRSVVESYKWSDSFKRGYERNRNLLGFDVITGLTYCDKAKTVVNAAYKGKTNNPTEIQYYLDLAWETLLPARKVFPVKVKQVGRTGHVKSTSLIGDKKCDAIFRYDESGQGDWEVTCTDGTKAMGNLQTLGPGKGSRGNGFDSDGNKIDFRITQERPGV